MPGISAQAVEGLPESFVDNMKTIFSIFDKDKSGYIETRDIEDTWDEGCAENLPRDVVGCLREVSLPNGLLTFDLFLGGLRLALSRGTNKRAGPAVPRKVVGRGDRNLSSDVKRAGSVPNLGQSARPKDDAKFRPYAVGMEDSGTGSSTTMSSARWEGSLSRPGDRHSLAGELDEGSLRRGRRGEELRMEKSKPYLSVSRDDMLGAAASNGNVSHEIFVDTSESYRRQVPRRRESNRRHTLGHGVDNNTIRRMRQLQQEKEVLSEGLRVCEATRDWYCRRINDVEQKYKFAGQAAGPSEHSLDSCQERINLERARVLEINQQLQGLIDSSEKGFPFHMNLAVRRSDSEDTSHPLSLLRAQNKMLTKEVSQKNDKVKQLEREKMVLLRDLFEMRAAQDRSAGHAPAHVRNYSYEESGFM